MDFGTWLTILSIGLGIITPILAWNFKTLLSTKSTTDNHVIEIGNLKQQVAGLSGVPVALATLGEVCKNLNTNVERLEAAMVRRDNREQEKVDREATERTRRRGDNADGT